MTEGAGAKIVALVPLPAVRGAMGLPAAWQESWAGGTVLGAVVKRLLKCRHLSHVVLLAEAGAEKAAGNFPDQRVRVRPVSELWGGFHDWASAGRKWSMTCWRGGLGGATCWDEILAPQTMLQAMEAEGASAALLAGADWPFIDSALCDQILERYLEQPEINQFCFSQAPPGLSGAVMDRRLLENMHRVTGMIGQMLDYQPRLPQPDPIGRDPCVLIDPLVRDTIGRFIFDAPRWKNRLFEIVSALGSDAALQAGALQVAEAYRRLPGRVNVSPQQVTIELDARRRSHGPLAPDHGVQRGPLDLKKLEQWCRELAREPDTVVTFGGQGEPFMHPQWREAIDIARSAGLLGVHWMTDLLEDEATLRAFAALPVDAVSVRLPADTAETYRKLMGTDGFARVLTNMQILLEGRRPLGRGLPHVAMRLAKTKENVGELAGFFDRWTLLAGHAVIDPPADWAGELTDLAVIDMSPPRRQPCRQLETRLTVLADGTAALCDQDVRGTGLDRRPGCAAEAWELVQAVLARHRQAGEAETLPALCRSCRHWHRP